MGGNIKKGILKCSTKKPISSAFNEQSNPFFFQSVTAQGRLHSL